MFTLCLSFLLFLTLWEPGWVSEGEQGWQCSQGQRSKEQLQELWVPRTPHGRHCRGAGSSPRHSLEILVLLLTLGSCVGQHRAGSLTSALLSYATPGFLACGTLLASASVFSNNHSGTGRWTLPPETSSQQCYFKDKLQGHCKAF